MSRTDQPIFSSVKVPLILVAAPSGAGKNSFVERICREDKRLCDVITCTTREMRLGESQGNPYFFLSEKEFLEQKEQGAFVEWAHVHGKLYGTRRQELESIWNLGLTGIMDVDVQGVRTFRKQLSNCKTLFILPPSLDVLRERIIKRDGQVPKDLDLRLKTAQSEILEAPQFDAQVMNDDFEASFRIFASVIDSWLRA